MTRYRVQCDECGIDRVQGRPQHKCRTAHPANCGHCKRVRALRDEYRMAREAAELARESVTAGYATEQADYGPLITFRDWLVQTQGASASDWEMAS